MRRFVIMIMVLCLLLTCASAESGETRSPWLFSTEDYALTGYTGEGGMLTIPAVMEDCPVEILGAGLMRGRTDLQRLVIPEGCNTICPYAFENCTALEGVMLPDTMQVLDVRCFAGCTALTAVRIPASVGLIGAGAFAGCKSLTAVTFEGREPAIPSGNAFDGLPADAVYCVPPDRLEAYRAILPAGAVIVTAEQDALPFSYVPPESDFLFDAETGTIRLYRGFAPVLEIPAAIDGVPVRTLGYRAFQLRYTCRIIIPEGVTVIESQCFRVIERSSLSWVDLPGTLREIGDRAFQGVNFQPGSTLMLPERITALPEGVFADADLTGLQLPGSVASIGDEAFARSAVREIYLDGTTLPDMGENVFANCGAIALQLHPRCTAEVAEAVQAQLQNLQAEVTVSPAAQSPYLPILKPGRLTDADPALAGVWQLTEVIREDKVTNSLDSRLILWENGAMLLTREDRQELLAAWYADEDGLWLGFPDERRPIIWDGETIRMTESGGAVLVYRRAEE